MSSLGKFLFGGLLGVAIGFLVSPKQARQVRDALMAPGTPRGRTTPYGGEPPSLEATTDREPLGAWEPERISEPVGPPEFAPVAEPEPEPEPEPEIILEPAGVEEEEVGEASIEQPAEEQPAEEQAVEEQAAPPDVAEKEPHDRSADLKARIEETRRRIQKELEQPFAEDEQAADAEEEPQEASFGEYASPPSTPERSEAHFPEPREAPVAESPGAGMAGPTDAHRLQPAAAIPDEDVVDETSDGDEEGSDARTAPQSAMPFDHEAMRQRIEETRNRLKAKAFDAMMNGEGALLSRGSEDDEDERANGNRGRSGLVASVDEEVDESIEQTLREEDD